MSSDIPRLRLHRHRYKVTPLQRILHLNRLPITDLQYRLPRHLQRRKELHKHVLLQRRIILLLHHAPLLQTALKPTISHFSRHPLRIQRQSITLPLRIFLLIFAPLYGFEYYMRLVV